MYGKHWFTFTFSKHFYRVSYPALRITISKLKMEANISLHIYLFVFFRVINGIYIYIYTFSCYQRWLNWLFSRNVLYFTAFVNACEPYSKRAFLGRSINAQILNNDCATYRRNASVSILNRILLFAKTCYICDTSVNQWISRYSVLTNPRLRRSFVNLIPKTLKGDR